ncbi:MAG TPA: hypothetical protein VJU15_02505 [Gemmatimonadales bacterium]|nr:hypothetical protein [Gemmatimonadales bacterium]
MQSLGGLQPAEVPCVRCHERIPGLAWGERCPACRAERSRRARKLARSISLIASAIAGLVLGLQVTPGPNARMLIGVGVVGTFLLTRVIAQRLAMEFLPD